MATQKKVSRLSFDTTDLLDVVDETKLGSGAKVGKKKTANKKQFKLKKPVRPLDSLNDYGK